MIMILIWIDYRRRNPTSLIILIYTFVSAWCPSQPLILSHPQKPDCPKPTTSYNLPPFASSSHNSRIHDFVPGVVAVSRHAGVFAWESMESGIRIWKWQTIVSNWFRLQWTKVCDFPTGDSARASAASTVALCATRSTGTPCPRMLRQGLPSWCWNPRRHR